MYLSRYKCNAVLSAVLATSIWAVAAPVGAQQNVSASGSQEAASADNARDHKWPQATLQAEAASEVAHDTVRITLATEVSEATQAAVAQALTQTLDKVMKQAKGNAKVKAFSGDYRVWPMNDKDGKISDWRGRAEIILESNDFAEASRLASELSDRMPIDGLAFSVSPKLRAEQEDTLLAQAAQAFRDRAQALVTAFGYQSYAIKQIDLGGAGVRFESAPRMMAMSADSKVAVPLEPGTERITVTVHGSIFLHSNKK
ncbi:SIMPL domain-containing protein [Pusillimonas sp. ANT_WB101]|uniref:SIMPL domain-containing protein n=1 Tax=Pusillimonas sp. ANT_WB101 TaxID=2597356 RepID=UPI0011EDB060|nr:SIMPL domain-containing protein [Pusillimonas sp. ANT_WB101]KAA0890568.1 DUF541 domain-containing protein [Pusillimonas sp. ANT_WB101]